MGATPDRPSGQEHRTNTGAARGAEHQLRHLLGVLVGHAAEADAHDRAAAREEGLQRRGWAPVRRRGQVPVAGDVPRRGALLRHPHHVTAEAVQHRLPDGRRGPPLEPQHLGPGRRHRPPEGRPQRRVGRRVAEAPAPGAQPGGRPGHQDPRVGRGGGAHGLQVRRDERHAQSLGHRQPDDRATQPSGHDVHAVARVQGLVGPGADARGELPANEPQPGDRPARRRLGEGSEVGLATPGQRRHPQPRRGDERRGVRRGDHPHLVAGALQPLAECRVRLDAAAGVVRDNGDAHPRSPAPVGGPFGPYHASFRPAADAAADVSVAPFTRLLRDGAVDGSPAPQADPRDAATPSRWWSCAATCTCGPRADGTPAAR